MTDNSSASDGSPASVPFHSEADCLFCKIVKGEIPSRKVYEDDEVFAFHDIRPAAPVHFMIIPKTHVDNLYGADLRYQSVLGRILGLTGKLATEQGLTDGFRVVINTGRVGRQEVYHLHIHVLGGPDPVGPGMRI